VTLTETKSTASRSVVSRPCTPLPNSYLSLCQPNPCSAPFASNAGCSSSASAKSHAWLPFRSHRIVPGLKNKISKIWTMASYPCAPSTPPPLLVVTLHATQFVGLSIPRLLQAIHAAGRCCCTLSPMPCYAMLPSGQKESHSTLSYRLVGSRPNAIDPAVTLRGTLHTTHVNSVNWPGVSSKGKV
jgi:hypothetical protein